MYNRYHGTNPALVRTEELLGREDVLQELDNHMNNRRSVVVMGAEGVGKSSLLNCYFNLQYRQRMAAKQRILIRVTDFPIDRDADGIYQYLAEGVLHAVDALDQEETADAYRKLQEKCVQKMKGCQDAASRFQQVCEVIQEFGYYIMLVIDGFERFVSSPQVKMEHHNLMNTLISKNLSFVVATNFDFNQDSLPAMVSGSFLLMKFAGNEIKLKGLSEKACYGLVDPGDFSSDEIHQMWILSGGIPFLFRKAAEHTYLHKQQGEIAWKDVLMETYQDVCPLLARWCKLLSANQVRVLNALLDQESKTGTSFEDGALNIAAQALVDRGLLANPIEAGTLRAISGLYKFNTPLLKLYCKEHTLQAETISAFQAEQAEEALVSTLENPEIDEDKIVAMYQAIASSRGLPMPVDFQEELPDSFLQEFELHRSVFDRFHPSVQGFIANGIRVERTLAGIEMLDFSPTYISFAKAVETHINMTLVPVLKKIAPEEVIVNNGRQRRLGEIDHMMLGAVKYILERSYRGTGGSFIATAGQYCVHNLGAFPESWWRGIRDDMRLLQTTRNEIPHSDFFSGEDGKVFLSKMFGGNQCFFLRCQNVYDKAVERRLLS